jgi:hypothetical protein
MRQAAEYLCFAFGLQQGCAGAQVCQIWRC